MVIPISALLTRGAVSALRGGTSPISSAPGRCCTAAGSAEMAPYSTATVRGHRPHRAGGPAHPSHPSVEDRELLDQLGHHGVLPDLRRRLAEPRASDTIVIYNEADFSGVRVFFNSPIKDFGFGFALILLTLSVWTRLTTVQDKEAE